MTLQITWRQAPSRLGMVFRRMAQVDPLDDIVRGDSAFPREPAIFVSRRGLAGPPGDGAPWYFAPPLAADFTLSNSGLGDLVLTDDSDVGLTIVSPSIPAGALNHAIATQAVPAGSWTATMRMLGTPFAPEYMGLGMILHNVGGQAYMHGARRYGAGMSAMCNRWNSLTSLNSDFARVDDTSLADVPWRRIVFDSATGLMTFQVGVDGKDWLDFITENISGFFGGSPPTDIGLFMGGGGSGTGYILAAVDNWSLV